jgi:aryl-alcohol dehydrogenase-like predicted oxidoreductase
MLGQWMTDRGNRDDIFLTAKVGAKPKTKEDDMTNIQGLSAKVIYRAVEESLQNLKTDVIDLYYAHIDDRKTPLEETLEAFDVMVRSGFRLPQLVMLINSKKILEHLKLI